MNIDVLVVILGSFISLLLMVNAFFTRKTLEKINDVELKLVELITKHDATDERSRVNQIKIDKLEDRLIALESTQNK